ncbi:MAG: sugar O-acetyltransferase [Armatimonadota bacterium]|nr:sugar O-acetyltransferase [Armatimonadota bacterium]
MAKTEKQKSLAGELYLASDPELAADRKVARRLTRMYNRTTEDEIEERKAILRELFGGIGPNVEIEPPFYCDYGYNIFAGDHVYVNFGCVILDCNEVHIGDHVMLAPYVQIYAAYHPTDAKLRNSGPELAAPVRIGSNVWLGGGVIVLPGVTIGDNTTIGAGSVVVKDIPANVVAVGNPCRVIKHL